MANERFLCCVVRLVYSIVFAFIECFRHTFECMHQIQWTSSFILHGRIFVAFFCNRIAGHTREETRNSILSAPHFQMFFCPRKHDCQQPIEKRPFRGAIFTLSCDGCATAFGSRQHWCGGCEKNCDHKRRNVCRRDLVRSGYGFSHRIYGAIASHEGSINSKILLLLSIPILWLNRRRPIDRPTVDCFYTFFSLALLI